MEYVFQRIARRVKKNSLSGGFTLMELLIVIAIIGILVSVSVASYGSAQIKTRDGRRKQDMKAVQNAMEQYYADNGNLYPTGTQPNFTCATTLSNFTAYLPVGFPVDPKNADGYVYSGADVCDGTEYCYCAKMESTTGGNATLVGAQTIPDCTSMSNNGSWFCVKNVQ